MLNSELGEGGDPKMDMACFLPPGNFLGRKEACTWLAPPPPPPASLALPKAVDDKYKTNILVNRKVCQDQRKRQDTG